MKTLSNQWTITEEKIDLGLYSSEKATTSKKLTGIEITLACEPKPLQTKEAIANIVGTHFEVKAYPNPQTQSMKVIINPKEYCLVDGAMMYSTLSHILKQLTKNQIYFTSVTNLYNQEWVPSFPS